MKIRFIGDVHANFTHYTFLSRAPGVDMSIQVGDFGVGFAQVPPLEPHEKFIRGNHDNPDECLNIPGYIPDGSHFLINDTKIFCIGGAFSIDAAWRTPGFSWWPNEECKYSDFFQFEEEIRKIQPDIIVTHDGPQSVVATHLLPSIFADETSVTRTGLDMIFENYAPKLWIFGHHHRYMDRVIKNTRFICLDELGIFDLDA